MTTSSVFPTMCRKCGRDCGGVVTYFGGLATCGYCAHAMHATGDFSWLQSKAPIDGPGSHAWDLREMRAQTARADRAERDLAKCLAHASTDVTVLEARVAELEARLMTCGDGCEDCLAALSPAPAKDGEGET